MKINALSLCSCYTARVMILRKKTTPKSLLLLVFVCALLLGTRSTAVQAQDPVSEMFLLINQFRAEIGLPPFTWNGTLAAAAQQQANYIASSGIYTHTGGDGSSPQTRANALGYSGYVVENIVGGGGMTPRQGLIWWQNSPVHYNTLVSTRHTEAGVGYVAGNQNRFALVVGRPSNAPAVSSTTNNATQSAAPIVVAPITLAEPDADGRITHTVGQGQALWTLSAYYEVSLADILQFNDLGENALVQPGDEIIIQLGANDSLPPTPTPAYSHVVQEGQTLWTVAALHSISLPNLLLYNSLAEDALIRPGDELKVRLREGESPPPTATPQLTYTVQSGDAFLAIAGRFGLSLADLLALNNLSESDFLQPGDVLLIRPPDPDPEPAVPATFTPAPAPTDIVPTPQLPTATFTPAAVAIVNPTGVPVTATSSVEDAGNEEAGEMGTALSEETQGYLMGFGAIFLAIVLFAGIVYVFANRPV